VAGVAAVTASSGGAPLWEHAIGHGHSASSSPVVIGGTMYVGSGDGHLYALTYRPGLNPSWTM
jgi:outer membrane protein assembly factor BamB